MKKYGRETNVISNSDGVLEKVQDYN